jgi:hypothetical protein
MPYVTRKKIKLFFRKPLILKVDLADDTLPRHYMLDSGVKTFLRGTVSLLVDESFYVKCVINKDYEFEVRSKGSHEPYGGVSYERCLFLPEKLVKRFAIDEGMGIELILHEVAKGEMLEDVFVEKEVEQIFPDVRIDGSMDFESKGPSGEILASSELLITTKFDDEFYDELVFEINSVFSLRLFTATMVLVRKLFERLIIKLLRQKYGMPQIELFYSTQDNGFHSLSTLIRNLRKKIDDFKPYDFFKLDREKESFLNFLWNMKEEGDASAHSLGPILGREEINALKPSINKYSDLFIRLIQKVKETP